MSLKLLLLFQERNGPELLFSASSSVLVFLWFDFWDIKPCFGIKIEFLCL